VPCSPFRLITARRRLSVPGCVSICPVIEGVALPWRTEQIMTMRYQHVLRSAARLAGVPVMQRVGQSTRLWTRTARGSTLGAAPSGADLLRSSFSRVDKA
jgi:hypothetical protein